MLHFWRLLECGFIRYRKYVKAVGSHDRPHNERRRLGDIPELERPAV